MKLSVMHHWIRMAGTVAFPSTPVLAMAPNWVNLIGIRIFGVIAAIGGRTMQDVIMGVPVFWATNLSYIWVALASSLAAFALNNVLAARRSTPSCSM